MLNELKKQVENELKRFVRAEAFTRMRAVSPLLQKSLADYILRGGKRIRPILCLIGYRGYSKRTPRGLLTTAIAMELIHDFLLIHDDIVDKSDMRRGHPALHTALQACLPADTKKISGSDLAIVAADVLYALSLKAFMAIQENSRRKEHALEIFVDAAQHTGTGEFIELLESLTPINALQHKTIMRIYDYKTAYYTFAGPLSIGALLAGAPARDISAITSYGICMGRAFQIRDDVLGMFSEEHETGKSALTDLQEAKKTLLVWHAWQKSTPAQKATLKHLYTKRTTCRSDIIAIRALMTQTKSYAYAQNCIKNLCVKAQSFARSLHMRSAYKQFLIDYPRKFL